MEYIDLTPSWGEWGNIFYRFALSGERNAVKTLHPDMARAFAFAEAFKFLQPSLTKEQLLQATATIEDEMQKQGLTL